MAIHNLSSPPQLGGGLSWRELWRTGAFIQLDLTPLATFSSTIAERGIHVGIGQQPFEALDLAGVLQPIAFSTGHRSHGFLDPKPFEDWMVFREEQPASEWSTYAKESRSGRKHTTALYSPWQMLYVDDVVGGGSIAVGLDALLAPAEQRDATFEQLRSFLSSQESRWHALDSKWRPLMKLLVRLQNRYLPDVTRRTRILYDSEQHPQVDPWPAEFERFKPEAVVAQLGISVEQLKEAYWFLVERGIDREPRDGLELLRRARPRSSQERWRGAPRRAQDHFDAAQLLHLFLLDFTGEPPSAPRGVPLDGRQRARAALYEAGPASPTSRTKLQEELVVAGLYPHAVHIVGEGKCEQEIVTTLVSHLLGDHAAKDLGFTDLGGSGSASRLSTMVDGFTTYALRTVVIVDSEGEMAEYVEGLVRYGKLSNEDVCRFKLNLEESNFTPDELLDVLTRLAVNPPDERPPVALNLSPEDVARAHAERCKKNRGREKPGLAGTLLTLAEDSAYGGPVRISKPEFAVALAERMLEDLEQAGDDEAALQATITKRPLLQFVVDRIVPILSGPRWR